MQQNLKIFQRSSPMTFPLTFHIIMSCVCNIVTIQNMLGTFQISVKTHPVRVCTLLIPPSLPYRRPQNNHSTIYRRPISPLQELSRCNEDPLKLHPDGSRRQIINLPLDQCSLALTRNYLNAMSKIIPPIKNKVYIFILQQRSKKVFAASKPRR